MILRRAFPEDHQAILDLQEAAYAPNRAIIGRDPLPLTWDYGRVLAEWECWVLADGAGLAGLLILQSRPDDLYIESIAVVPRAQGMKLGKRLLAKAHDRAGELGRETLRLLANERLTRNWQWYRNEGFRVELIEDLGDRRLVHMVKDLSA
jgi:ribosomal protein S18 acetylase RimI-like enzyme